MRLILKPNRHRTNCDRAVGRDHDVIDVFIAVVVLVLAQGCKWRRLRIGQIETGVHERLIMKRMDALWAR